ncbi:Fis family transcriptional regulator [Hahella sp. CCB-MM4]|uniref:sigma-54 interaction domain-containing protein n=1 Tax=Hahella sp. (strain CCB-MM4) TaxID=1926491 RepID=UPI000BD246F1|nr:sigma-54-dependent Fis family transcriptional regulator [Hahella sp. CCB-MM4]OZG74876.1 Fis family transcriptional regulator [Hahella sp. CCB-MM4]
MSDAFPLNLPSLTSMLEAIPAPAVLLDREYRIRAANNLYRQTFQQDASLINQNCFRVSHGYSVPCDQAGETCPLRQSLQTGQRQRILHIHNTPKGKEHVDVEMTPVRDEKGEIQFFVETMTPVYKAQGQKHMIGFSPAYTHMLDLLNRAASSDISVLLLGESGTGKELAARHLHDHSPRAGKPFVTVECSGLTDSLFESELFGYEKGAFTGANQRKQGLVEAASGGTLFLDEIGDIPLSMQVKLLRLIESATYRPVGSVTSKQADFRLICATHKSLPALIRVGGFREDLYYRISPFPVVLPSLRDRREDIPHIARHILEVISQKRPRSLSNDAMNWLQKQSFPGNIRELRNRLERAVLLCDLQSIEPEHLEMDLGEYDLTSGEEPKENDADNRPRFLPRVIMPLEELEKTYLAQVVDTYRGDKLSLARELGISERTLYRKLKELDR